MTRAVGDGGRRLGRVSWHELSRDRRLPAARRRVGEGARPPRSTRATSAVAGMLHGRIVRSPYASARIVRIDTSAARALPGVVAVLTHARRAAATSCGWSCPGRMAEATAGAVLATQPVLADGRVRFQGEPVVAIAAETPGDRRGGRRARASRLRGAAGRLRSARGARSPARPTSTRAATSSARWHLRKGDIAEGFARADVVVEQTYRTPFVDHVYLETESGHRLDRRRGRADLRVSTQVLEHFRDVAEVLRLPHGRVRLEGAYLGGGFGGKEDVTVECLLGLLVWKTRRPVQLVFSREESFIGHGKRHPYVLRYRTGATRSGELVALEAELISDSGAYAALSPWVLLYSLVTATGPYRVPNVKVDAVTVYTNNPIASAYRTFGSIQTCVAYEGQMDALAGRSAWTRSSSARRTFCARATASPRARCSRPSRCSARRCGARGRRSGPARPGAGAGADRRAGSPPRSRPTGACAGRATRPAPGSGMELDGTAVVRCAAPDVGGGQTVLALLDHRRGAGAARRAGHRRGPRQPLHPARRHDHGHAPALDVRQRRAQGRARGAPSPGGPGGGDARGRRRPISSWPTGGLRPRRAGSRAAPCRASSRPRRRRAARPGARQVRRAVGADHRPATGQGKPFNDYTFGTQAVEVEVDDGDGSDARDAGSSPATTSAGPSIAQSAEGQIEGGAVQGLGHALLEEVVLEDGVSKNPHLARLQDPDHARRAGHRDHPARIRPRARPLRRQGHRRARDDADARRRHERRVPRRRRPHHGAAAHRRARARGAHARRGVARMPLFEEQFTVSATPETVWAFLLDPQRLAPCLPGLRQRSRSRTSATYRVRLTVKVGFLSTPRTSTSRSSSRIRPRHLVSLARGEEPNWRAGSKSGTRSICARRRGRTYVCLRSEVTVLGRLGSVGDAVMKVKAKQLAGQLRRERARRRSSGPRDPVDFTLNGRPCAIEAPDHWTVLDLLRDGLAPDGHQVRVRRGRVRHLHRAARRPADPRLPRAGRARSRGRALVTVEGLDSDGGSIRSRPHSPSAGAAQCGYCTPGHALAARRCSPRTRRRPSTRFARRSSGNLCRCTGYTKIIDAVLAARGTDGKRAPASVRAESSPRRSPKRSMRSARLDGEARLVAGGTALVAMIRLGLVRPDRLISLHRVAGSDGIRVEDGSLELGAMATLADIERSRVVRAGWPLLAEAVRPRRHARRSGPRGPSAAISLMPRRRRIPRRRFCASTPRCAWSGAAGERTVPIARFFTGFYETALEPARS